MSQKKLKLILTFSILFLLIILASPNRFRRPHTLAEDQTLIPDEVTVSATIGVNTRMSIFGYAPASSAVALTGTGISLQTTADLKGYFKFDPIYKSGSTDEYPELCIIAYVGSLSTQPTCIPPLPAGNNVYEIGPVILSPIISIEQNIFRTGDQVALNGITIPDSQVNIYLAGNEGVISFIPRVLAYYIPTFQVTSDHLGKFQFNLPSSTISKWRVYASTAYETSRSPKSNTLNFTVKSNVLYYLSKIYQTVVKTINVTTTVITSAAKKVKGSPPSAATSLNYSAGDVEMFRANLPYYVIAIQLIILIPLILIALKRRKKNRVKKLNQTSH